MRPFVESELIRTPLEEICLQCKRVSLMIQEPNTIFIWSFPIFLHISIFHTSFSSQLELTPGGLNDPDGIPAFLSKAMTPPHRKSWIR